MPHGECGVLEELHRGLDTALTVVALTLVQESESVTLAAEAVLSAMLMDKAAIAEVRSLDLRPDDFSEHRHALLFAAMLAVDSRGDKCDPITLFAELESRGTHERAGGKDYIGYLVDAAPTAANAREHATIVLNGAKGRGLATRLEEGARALRHGAVPIEVASRLRPALDVITDAGSKPKGFSTVRVMAVPPPDAQSVHVQDFVLDRDINLWAAPGGSGKSVVLLVTVIGIAIGRPVFGTLAVHRPGPVVLIVPEDGQSGARMMLDAIVAGMYLDTRERTLLSERLVMVPDDVSVNITQDARRLRSTALEHQAVLVAIDPKRNVLGNALENDNDVAGPCCDALRREVCRGAGATVIITDHNRKPGKDATADTAPSANDVRGASGWVNGSRLVFGLSKKGTRLTLSCLKANRLRADLRHELDLAIEADPNNAAHWLSCRLTDANAGTTSDALTPGIGRSLNANEQTALSCLDDQHEPGKRLSWSRWMAESGLNPNTFKSVRDRLITAGIAAAIPTGKKTRNGSPEYSYGITASGRKAVASGWIVDRPKGEGVSNGK